MTGEDRRLIDGLHVRGAQSRLEPEFEGRDALLVGAHFAFRIAYYGDWLPNTYYAKVDGRSWWEMGFHYLACFSLEYAIYLWIPLLAAGWVAYRRRGQAVVPMIFAAICLPHALYVASTGGDHFEYRPLDLYFPFAYLLMAAGAVELCRSRTAARLVFVYTAIVLVGIVEIPYRSHVEFPAEYSHGFPGKRALKVGGDRFLDPARSWVYRLPGLRTIAAGHQAQCTSALEIALPQWKALGRHDQVAQVMSQLHGRRS